MSHGSMSDIEIGNYPLTSRMGRAIVHWLSLNVANE
jgi:hypothetical protein